MAINNINQCKDEIVERYKNGETLRKLAKEYHVGYLSAKKVLIQAGVEIRHQGYNKKIYSLNEYFFDEINTPEKAYILGLLGADGCVSSTRDYITISLQEGDQQLLEDVKNLLNYTGPLRFIPAKPSMKKNQWNLSIVNKHMKQALINAGIFPRKSLTFIFPTSVPENLYSHFIRGYFDGDGCFYLPEKKYRMMVTIAGTEIFCNKIKEILQTTVGIAHNIQIQNTKNLKTSTRVLKIYGIKNIKKFLNWIYQDSTISLQRKYEKYYNCFCLSQNELSLSA